MATVRPGTFRPEKQAAKTPDVQTITYTPDERVKLHSFGSVAQGKPLSQAEIIVAGGMGVGSQAGFKKLETLAKKLGGSLGAVSYTHLFFYAVFNLRNLLYIIFTSLYRAISFSKFS